MESQCFCFACQQWKSIKLFRVLGFDKKWLGTANYNKRCKLCETDNKPELPAPSDQRVFF
jgi:hypothetical protein